MQTMTEVSTRDKSRLGRPRGKGLISTRKWQPNVWEPIYESIVAESILGKTNIYLAEKYAYTEQQISNILNTEKAREIKREAVALIKNNSLNIIEGKLADSMDRAVHNIHEVLHNEDLLLHHPFSVVEKSIQVLKGLGKLQGDGPVTNNNNVTVAKGGQAVINLGEEAQKTFLDGLEKANRAIEMHKDVDGKSIK